MDDTTSIKDAVSNATVEEDGRVTLSCPAAFRIAETLDVDLSEIGRYCNDNGIRIVKCQLGCFS